MLTYQEFRQDCRRVLALKLMRRSLPVLGATLIAIFALGATGCRGVRPQVKGTVMTSFDVLQPGHRFHGEKPVNPPTGDLTPVERAQVRLIDMTSGRKAIGFSNSKGKFDIALPMSLSASSVGNVKLVISKTGFEPFELVVSGLELNNRCDNAKFAADPYYLDVWLPPESSF